MRRGWNPERESRLENSVFTTITAIILVILILSFSYFTRTTPLNSTTTTYPGQTTTTMPINYPCTPIGEFVLMNGKCVPYEGESNDQSK